MLKRYTEYRGYKCQIRRPLSRRDEDGRKWLGRPKLCTKSCRAVLKRRRYRKILFMRDILRKIVFPSFLCYSSK